MEVETVSKYAVNILLDFKPEEVQMRPEAAEIFRRRAAGSDARALPARWYPAGLCPSPLRSFNRPG